MAKERLRCMQRTMHKFNLIYLPPFKWKENGGKKIVENNLRQFNGIKRKMITLQIYKNSIC